MPGPMLRDDEAITIDFDPARLVLAIATPGELDETEALVCAALLLRAMPAADRDRLTAGDLVTSLRSVERKSSGFLAQLLHEQRRRRPT